jgi:hypothetical protein
MFINFRTKLSEPFSGQLAQILLATPNSDEENLKQKFKISRKYGLKHDLFVLVFKNDHPFKPSLSFYSINL